MLQRSRCVVGFVEPCLPSPAKTPPSGPEAVRARENLFPWAQATVILADGLVFRSEQPADAIVVNAGVSHIARTWLDMLCADDGQLLVPLTNSDGWGGFVLIERHAGEARRYPAQFVNPVGIIHCVGGRDAAAEERLKSSVARSRMTNIRSLRRAPDEPDNPCWLAGEGWWLSTAGDRFRTSSVD